MAKAVLLDRHPTTSQEVLLHCGMDIPSTITARGRGGGNVGYPQVLLGVGQQQVFSPYYYYYNGDSSQDPMSGGKGGSMSPPGPYYYPYPGLAYLTIAYVPVAL